MCSAPNHAERDHARLSASSSSRWMACPASASIEDTLPNTSSEFAAEGTTAHEVAQTALEYWRDKGRQASIKQLLAAVEGADEDMARYAKDYVAYIIGIVRELTTKSGSTVMAEVRLDLTDYIPDGFGTADAIVLTDTDMAVIDYKYGRGVKVEAEGNSQMRCYALGADAAFGDIYSYKNVRMCIFQPRIDHIADAVMSVEELRDWGENVLAPAANLAAEGGDGKRCAGTWCKFCKAAGECTELTSFVDEVVREDFSSEDWSMTDEQMDEALAKIPTVKLWVDTVERAALNALLEGSRNLPNFKVVEGRSTRAFDDTEAAFGALLDAGVEDAMLYERRPLTLAKIEKMLGKKAFNEAVGDHVIKPQGKPTLVPASDRRAEYSVVNDFDVE